MSRTVFTHTNCGGSIVAELRGFKLVSPYIGIGYSKLSLSTYQFLTNELKTPVGETEGRHVYICLKCKQELTNLETEITAICSICKEPFLAQDLITTDYIPILDMVCFKNLKGEEGIELRKVFELPERIRKTPLVEVLLSPMKI